MIARFHDWLRERRIRRLRRELLRVDPSLRAAIWRVMLAEIHRRSSRQIERMERDRGIV